MISFLKDNADGIKRDELTDLFNQHFGTNQSVVAIRTICKKYDMPHIKIGFPKGTSGYDNTKYKVGDECFLAGEWRVIISMESKVPILKRSEYKKRIIWQNEYGEIPKNHCFIYLDGDKRNCTLDNLRLVPLMWMRILNQNGWLAGNREVTLAALEFCKLHYALSVKDGNRYVKQNGQRYR